MYYTAKKQLNEQQLKIMAMYPSVIFKHRLHFHLYQTFILSYLKILVCWFVYMSEKTKYLKDYQL